MGENIDKQSELKLNLLKSRHLEMIIINILAYIPPDAFFSMWI